MADRPSRLLRWLRTEGADMAESIGMITIGIGVWLYLTSLAWPFGAALAVCVGVRLHRRAEQTAELARYRRGQS